MARGILLCGLVLCCVAACAPVPTPTATPRPASTRTPQPVPTATPLPTPAPVSSPTTSPWGQAGQVEGLVLILDGELILGVDWLSKSRITYLVKGGDAEMLKRLLGETARVTGVIVDRGPYLKEIKVQDAEPSTAEERLSMRAGYIKELGPSIYMQGSHVLMDREGQIICLLATGEGGPDLDRYMSGRVVVIGFMDKTVEGDAQIMTVQSVDLE
ncbi:MAG: hypothetical protein FJ026_02930 [Chloroflexi bacterium]|nr:hypothetical protein [Chloroflexota bacterium]